MSVDAKAITNAIIRDCGWSTPENWAAIESAVHTAIAIGTSDGDVEAVARRGVASYLRAIAAQRVEHADGTELAPLFLRQAAHIRNHAARLLGEPGEPL